MVYADDLKSLTERFVGSSPTPGTMAIKPRCDFCKKELHEFGALLFGPPNKKNAVRKLHLCKSCYRKVVARN